ncbi:LPS translocon maturation chaperone LptM [Chenggangzhangella methanolivorans]|uniref:Lipoprotein n=1 Tax=Chenggangzhangella methanolivorans TaxID=1437009 RepID=A0A9E6R5H0_9HYPH|nr:lipoprotein [Chenggangzhangella methanolivorans]QZN98567.1 lipoprotein [Chenggangzhangella methanolivorans]
MLTRAAALALIVATATALAACGKKGDPEYPSGTQMEKRTQPDGSTVEKPKRPDRPFVLDGLLN